MSPQGENIIPSLVDLIKDKSPYKEVDTQYVVDIIKNANFYGLKSKVVEFEDLIILGEDNFIDVESSRPILFKNCYFTGFFSLGDSVFEKPVEFKNCSFDHPIFLNSGDGLGPTFKSDLKFVGGIIKESKKKSGAFTIFGGKYETIYLAFDGNTEYRFNSGTFKLIDIGSYVGSDKIASVSILYSGGFDSNSKFGDIKIRGKELQKLYIGGVNKGNTFLFENLRVNNLHINDFRNEGDVKFFGLNSLKDQGRKAYLSIEKSILGKTQFFRTNFQSFDEVIVIDSLIIESTFVNVRWFNAISPRQGPGYSDFNEASRSKAYTLNELFQIREAYRQFKFALDKQGDKVQEGDFYEKEMNVYNQTINWKSHFWDKIVLHASDIFSKYGLSIPRPLIFLFIFNAIFCLLLNRFAPNPLKFTVFENHSWEALNLGIGTFFSLINPTHKTPEYITGVAVFYDLLSRVSSSFFLYNFIRATRRFVR